MIIRPPITALDLQPGMELHRWYKGKLYTVYIRRADAPPLACDRAYHRRLRRRVVRERGWYRYEYEGQRYATLSAITAVITGQPTIEGSRFFGLKPRKRYAPCSIQIPLPGTGT